MLHMLRTVGATGWLVSQKVLSLLWLAILSPGYYSDLCVFVCVCVHCLFLLASEGTAGAYTNSALLVL